MQDDVTDLPGIETQWIIEAPANAMREACQTVGVDLNALKYRDEDEDDAQLFYPSFFCPQARSWLAALAWLVSHHVAVRLHYLQTDPAQAGRVVAFSRIFPKFDEEVMAILRRVAAARAAQIEDLGNRVEMAFTLLHRDQASTSIAPDVFSEDYTDRT